MKHPFGESVRSAKLTEEQVREIRERYALWQANAPKILAEDYGMSDSTIRQIVRRELWKHV